MIGGGALSKETFARFPHGFGAAVLVCVLLSACASIEPEPAMPLTPQDIQPAWSEPVLPGAGVWPSVDWWRGFSIPELDALVRAARENNLDLAVATARVLQAEAQTRIVRSALFPTVGVAATLQPQAAIASGSTSANTLFSFGPQVSYELDFWGLARNNARAADALLRSARYAQETVALSVTSNVAILYLDVLALRERIAIARNSLQTAMRVLDGIERRTANGLSSPLDLAQQQALVAGQAAVIPALEQLERGARYALALLLGRAPEGFLVTRQNLEEIGIPAVAAGIPSELLTRRPDIAEAEARLLAASANVGAARAAFFPQISLTASAGLASGAVSAVTDGLVVGGASAAAGGTGLVVGAGVAVLQTIFDAGRRQGQVDLALAEQQELVATYRSTVFNAFANVELALGDSASLADQERFKSEQVQRATMALDISDVQYREGLVDLFALLQAQQTLFTAQDELLQIKLARIQTVVGLYKALGGGWTQATAEAPP